MDLRSPGGSSMRRRDAPGSRQSHRARRRPHGVGASRPRRSSRPTVRPRCRR
jgi:hypothetical protein